MRVSLILIVAVLSLGVMAAFEEAGTVSQPSREKLAYAQPGTLTGAVSAVRRSDAHLAVEDTWLEPSLSGQDAPRLAVGEVLPEGPRLQAVPRHESYRYAVVQGQRVIVDASSRQIVYIIR